MSHIGCVMVSAVMLRDRNNCAFLCRLSWSLLYAVYISITASLLTWLTLSEALSHNRFLEMYFFYFFYGMASVSLLLFSSLMHLFLFFRFLVVISERLQSFLGLVSYEKETKIPYCHLLLLFAGFYTTPITFWEILNQN